MENSEQELGRTGGEGRGSRRPFAFNGDVAAFSHTALRRLDLFFQNV